MSAGAPAGAGAVMPSVRALLAQIVDYAGLFPPAKLDMLPTVKNYREYLAGEDGWMLGRIVIPVARLDEFEKHAAGLLPRVEDAEPWRLSALTAAAGDAGLGRDIDRIAEFNATHGDPAAGLAVIDVIELKADSVGAIDSVLDAIDDEIYPYFEIASAGDPRGLIASLAGSQAGAKIRSGGVTADAYPGIEQVAGFIAACAAAEVPFKATAGLHHPLRHRNPSNGAIEHGFLNVFLGACAAHAGADREEIAGILAVQDAALFSFAEEGVDANGWDLATDQIAQARAALAVSFGSCSFDEPREDLRRLGLLR